MKLTNQQANAVAEKIFNEVKTKALEKKALEIKKVETEILKTFQKELKGLGNNVRGVEVMYKDQRVEIRRSLHTGDFYVPECNIRSFVKSWNVSVDTIKNDIILATIDASDLQELIRVVSLKYQ